MSYGPSLQEIRIMWRLTLNFDHERKLAITWKLLTRFWCEIAPKFSSRFICNLHGNVSSIIRTKVNNFDTDLRPRESNLRSFQYFCCGVRTAVLMFVPRLNFERVKPIFVSWSIETIVSRITGWYTDAIYCCSTKKLCITMRCCPCKRLLVILRWC